MSQTPLSTVGIFFSHVMPVDEFAQQLGTFGSQSTQWTQQIFVLRLRWYSLHTVAFTTLVTCESQFSILSGPFPPCLLSRRPGWSTVIRRWRRWWFNGITNGDRRIYECSGLSPTNALGFRLGVICPETCADCGGPAPAIISNRRWDQIRPFAGAVITLVTL